MKKKRAKAGCKHMERPGADFLFRPEAGLSAARGGLDDAGR
jgi:hypothetical protein